MSRIREKLAGYEIFECGDGVTFEYLLTKMQGTGCFVDKQLVIINQMPEFKDSNRQKYIKQFKEALECLDEDIYVVFNGIETTKEKALFTVVQKVGKVYEYQDTLDRKAAPQWVIEKIRKKGFAADYPLAEALIEN